MRPLTVKTVCSARPLFCRGAAVCGCSGGGKSRLRGVGAELQGDLIRGLAELSEEVADLLLTGVDDLASGGTVDGGGHVLTQLLEAAAQLAHQGVRRQGGFGRHGFSMETRATSTQPAQLRFPLNVGAP